MGLFGRRDLRAYMQERCRERVIVNQRSGASDLRGVLVDVLHDAIVLAQPELAVKSPQGRVEWKPATGAMVVLKQNIDYIQLMERGYEDV